MIQMAISHIMQIKNIQCGKLVWLELTDFSMPISWNTSKNIINDSESIGSIKRMILYDSSTYAVVNWMVECLENDKSYNNSFDNSLSEMKTIIMLFM